MNFNVIGLHPDNALKIALNIFDNKTSVDDKVKLLLNNRPVNNLNSVDTPANFASGKTIDLNTGELLGIGCVASYYNWMSEEAKTNNTYQAIVGVEDPAKRQIETLLSDGAIWHDQAEIKILVQQVMTQGYFPKKPIADIDVVNAIKKKMAQRDNYPENCVLIVNAFGNEIAIDRNKINDEIKELTNAFTDVYLVIYNLPLLTMAHVSYISQPDARGLAIKLERHEYKDEWEFNT
jgi:hypothetical protein